MGFSRQEYWSGLTLSPPGALPHPGIEAVSPVSPVLAGRLFTMRPLGSPGGQVSRQVLSAPQSNSSEMSMQ